MKVIRLARNALIGRTLMGLLALRRRAAERERRARILGAALFAACGAGAGWAARRALRARAGAAPQPAAAATRAPAREGARAARPAQPSVKKQRKRARRAEAEMRETADRNAAHGGPVKLEINETPDLRAPLGDLIKS